MAVTRARDLLVLPASLTGAGLLSWSRIVDLGLSGLPEFDAAALVRAPRTRSQTAANAQTPEVFAQEAQAVVAAAPRIVWRRPSEHDADRVQAQEVSTVEPSEGLLESPRPVGAGRARGFFAQAA